MHGPTQGRTVVAFARGFAMLLLHGDEEFLALRCVCRETRSGTRTQTTEGA
jgi:hypothetical protein